MRGASITAWAVSLARGVSRTNSGHALDPYATHLLPSLFAAPAQLLFSVNGSRLGAKVLDRASFGLFSHVSLRTRAIDHELLAFVDQSVSAQVLILGAGADARAYRLPALRRTRVFEVDHPATQAEKKARATVLVPLAEIAYVPVNFERDALDVALDRAGFNRTTPTFCIWEGVTPYLTAAAIAATLTTLHSLLPPTSVLAVTYGLPEIFPHLPVRGRPAINLFFNAIGEPLRGLVSTETFSSWLETHGYQSVSDTGVRDWVRAENLPVPTLLILERLAIAIRP